MVKGPSKFVHNNARVFLMAYENQNDFIDFYQNITRSTSQRLLLGKIFNIKAWPYPDAEKPEVGVVIFNASAGNRLGIVIFVHKTNLRNGPLFKNEVFNYKNKKRTELGMWLPVVDVGVNPNPSDINKLFEAWDMAEDLLEAKYKIDKAMDMPGQPFQKSLVKIGILTFKDKDDIASYVNQLKTVPGSIIKATGVKLVGKEGKFEVPKEEPEPEVAVVSYLPLERWAREAAGRQEIEIIICINTSIKGGLSPAIKNQKFFNVGKDNTEDFIELIKKEGHKKMIENFKKGSDTPYRLRPGVPAPIIHSPALRVYRKAAKGLSASKDLEEKFLKLVERIAKIKKK